MTTARLPAMAIADRSSSSITPDGVPAVSAGRFWTSLADVDGMKSVHVLFRRDRVEHLPLGIGAHGGRQRRLHENAVVLVAPIESINNGQQILEGCARGQPAEVGTQAAVRRRFQFVANVDLRGRIVADEHDAEPRRPPRPRGEGVHSGPDLRADRVGDGRAVEQLRRHVRAPPPCDSARRRMTLCEWP